MKLGLLGLFKASVVSTVAAAAAVFGLGGLNLYTYHRFTEEMPVAELAFEQLEARRFRVTLSALDTPDRQFVLQGDEWQLDARMIKWTDWLTFLGESPLYRLDRLSGRYIEIGEARRNGLSAHALSDDDTGIDIWAFAREAGDWLPGVDAAYGSSVFLPMRDGAIYEVSISRTGLLARRKPEDGVQ